ncbi:MAG: histidine kinase N-terminal 7TM domain-containing protein [Salinirussus sp.]
MTPVPWLAIGALLAGGLSLWFVRYLWPYRDRRAARFFIGTVVCEALWALSYGLALLVFDRGLRAAFEIPIWLGVNFIGVFFLAFALQYTGRGDLVRSKFMGAIVAIQALHTLIVATNPLHHIAWTDYAIQPLFGAATVTYTHQPWLFVNFAGIYIMVAAASFLLLETFYSYGRLYRAQTVALAISPVLPGLAFTLWLFEVGASPPLNLTPFTFPLHLAFDGYAFFRRNMFELSPAARRAGDRAAIDDLGTPVFVVDEDRRIINANDAAAQLDPDADGLIGRDVSTIHTGLDPQSTEGTITLQTDGNRREFAVNATALADASDTTIGYTITLQDVTAEKQREQRLSVLNRVLRHNLRNDLNVVRANIDVASREVGSGTADDALERAERKTGEVIELGEKARTIERLLETDGSEAEAVPLAALLAELREEYASPAADIRIDIPEDLRIQGNRSTLHAVFENLLENAIEHGGSTIDVDCSAPPDPSGRVTVSVRDDGPGIPEHERRPIQVGEETALEHGSGLGLWIVSWGIAALGGDLEFDSDADGTIIRLTLPVAEEPQIGEE